MLGKGSSDAAARARRFQRRNRVGVAAALALHLFALLIVPLALLPLSRWWGLALLPVALLSNPLWSLTHEAIHGQLASSRRGNEIAGRILGVLHGASFGAVRVGHLLHHRYSRTVRERTEVYDPRRTRRGRAAAGYYFGLLGGTYLLEVLGTLLSLMPRAALVRLERRLDREDSVAGLVVRALCRPAALAALRVDATLILVLGAASLALYGACAWMPLAAYALRALLVSFADNSYHYDTPLDRPAAARNLRAPRWLELALLNFTLHGVHHAHPTLPWYELRRRFDAERRGYDGGWFAALGAQLRGPIPVTAFREERA